MDSRPAALKRIDELKDSLERSKVEADAKLWKTLEPQLFEACRAGIDIEVQGLTIYGRRFKIVPLPRSGE